MDGAIFISGIVGLIYLVAFFALCDNVSKITRSITQQKSPDYWLQEYNKHRYFSETALAKTALQNHIWYALKRKSSKKFYEELQTKYRTTLESLGGHFPDYPY